MPVLDFKPHEFCYSVVTKGDFDENGYYTGDTIEWSEPVKVNAVQNEGAELIHNYADGEDIQYTYTIYLEKNCKDFVKGEKVRLNYYGKQVELTVKGFKRFQHQCKLWV